jgi:OHCU decarboxylase
VQSAKARSWSQGEQAVAQKTDAATRKALADANRSYQARFGHIFLICATGKTSKEILTTLQQRLPNDPRTELLVTAEEQRKITRLRLEKLLTP